MSRILIVDDHPLFRLALTQALRELLPDCRLEEADSLSSARQQLQTHTDIDLVLLDLHLPGSHGLAGLASLRGEFPAVAVAMISAHEDPRTIRRALEFGASGYLLKSADLDELTRALGTVLEAKTYVPPALQLAVNSQRSAPQDRELAQRLNALTPQQSRVLGMVAEGLLNKQIADQLGISERTVKAHLSALFERLGVRNRTQAGVLLRSLELADPSRRVADDPEP
jgi:DNA-binding NarL/FixJ family response regulator